MKWWFSRLKQAESERNDEDDEIDSLIQQLVDEVKALNTRMVEMSQTLNRIDKRYYARRAQGNGHIEDETGESSWDFMMRRPQ